MDPELMDATTAKRITRTVLEQAGFPYSDCVFMWAPDIAEMQVYSPTGSYLMYTVSLVTRHVVDNRSWLRH